MKTFKFDEFVNESNNRFFPEDWTNCKDGEEVIDAMIEALPFTGIYGSLCKPIDTGLDPYIY